MTIENTIRQFAKDRAAAPAQAQHSPLPWVMDETLLKAASGRTYKSNAVITNGKLVGQLVGFSESDAALIVRACNNAQRLADALKDCVECVNDELGASGEDEVRQHPVLTRHKKVAAKCEKILAEWSKQK